MKKAFLMFVFICMLGGATYGEFIKIDEFVLPTSNSYYVSHYGIAYDGLNWHISRTFTDTYMTYNNNFEHLYNTSVSGVGSMRSLTYDRNSNHLFVGDYDTGIIREVTLEGIEIQQFSAAQTIGALAYDAITDTIWVSRYTHGLIEHRTRTGELLDSFTFNNLNWVGMAFDEINNTLLLSVTGGLYEVSTEGDVLGKIVTTPLISGTNAQGLAYDSASGKLWVTSQFGQLAIYQDYSRVPEPATLSLLALGGLTLLRKRK